MPVNIYHDISLRDRHTFHMDVKAARLIEYDTQDELLEILPILTEEKALHIGAGSNLLFTKDFSGTLLHSRINTVEIEKEGGDVLVRVGSGVVWDKLCEQLAQRNIRGAENLSYIPGECGAAAVQNIGAYGMEVCRLVESVETVEMISGTKRVFGNQECAYGYRHSIFKGELKGQYIVTAVNLRLRQDQPFNLEYGGLKELRGRSNLTVGDVRDEVVSIRRSKLPETDILGSAGSFFKNPVVSKKKFEDIKKEYPDVPHYILPDNKVKIPCAWMIDTLGWKGVKRGGAGVYEKQPLILVNTGRALPEDIISLAADISRSIKEKFDIEIHPEVNYI